MCSTTLIKWKIKIIWSPQMQKKSTWHNTNPFMIKNSHQSCCWENASQHNNGQGDEHRCWFAFTHCHLQAGGWEGDGADRHVTFLGLDSLFCKTWYLYWLSMVTVRIDRIILYTVLAWWLVHVRSLKMFLWLV